MCLAGGPVTQIEHNHMDAIRDLCLRDLRSEEIGQTNAKIEVKKFATLDLIAEFVRDVALSDGHYTAQALKVLKCQQHEINARHRHVDWRLMDYFTQRLMIDPVIAEDGHDYDRKSILQWFHDRNRTNQPIVSPYTKEVMGESLTPNSELRLQIQYRCILLAQEVDIVRSDHLKPACSLRDFAPLFQAIRDADPTTWTRKQRFRLVIIGSESSGKSSLLERLCLLRLFPTAQRICTVLPIKIMFNPPNTDDCRTSLQVYNVATKQYENDSRMIPLCNGQHDVGELMRAVLREEQKRVESQQISVEREIHVKAFVFAERKNNVSCLVHT